jgi:NAD+ synthase (glutamine-hydrolysing)
MLVALAQIHPVLGDFEANSKLMLDKVEESMKAKAELVVFPELSLFGYQPMDLLERSAIVQAQLAVMRDFVSKVKKRLNKNAAVIFGAVTPSESGKPYYNSAVFVTKTKRPAIFHKELLPSYDVFDETRHFRAGSVAQNKISFAGSQLLVSVCEDLWGWPLPSRPSNTRPERNPMAGVKGKVNLVVSINGSPYSRTKQKTRMDLAKKTAKHFHCPVVYLNMVGAQDEQIYDGRSFVINAAGQILGQAPGFRDCLLLVDTQSKPTKPAAKINPSMELRDALVLGLRDFLAKTGGQRAHLGLSGGIDSAVVACLAVDAIGKENVACLALPGPYSAPESLDYARRLAKKLGTPFFELPIQGIYDSTLKQLKATFGEWEFGVTHENLQSRARSLALMAYSNQMNSFLLSTSNKCELSTGYSTLYGDMCGALAPLGDLLKSEVYDIADLYRAFIPNEIIERPPTAELRPNQTDQDTLPPYDILDKIVVDLVEKQKAATTTDAKKVLQMMYRSEFNRWQAPPILRVSDHGFGRGRRMPIAHLATE